MPIITLFLDFDGVLTPMPPRVRGGFDWFSRLPCFESTIRPFIHDLEIIVSSDWRHKRSLDNIKTNFSQDVADRIYGTTGVERWRRELEIEEWLADNPREHWVALDDLDDHFTTYFDRLIAINRTVGFSEDDGKRLVAAVNQMKQLCTTSMKAVAE